MKSNLNNKEHTNILNKINRSELPVDVETVRTDTTEQKKSILEQSLDQIVDSKDNKKTH